MTSTYNLKHSLICRPYRNFTSSYAPLCKSSATWIVATASATQSAIVWSSANKDPTKHLPAELHLSRFPCPCCYEYAACQQGQINHRPFFLHQNTNVKSACSVACLKVKCNPDTTVCQLACGYTFTEANIVQARQQHLSLDVHNAMNPLSSMPEWARRIWP